VWYLISMGIFTLQPLKLEVKRKLTARSDRVKSVDLHPSEPWLLVSLYNGNVHIWNHDNQQLIKTLEVSSSGPTSSQFSLRREIQGTQKLNESFCRYVIYP
jgi:WD40 repeat protein